MEGIGLMTANWAQTTCASFGLRYVFLKILSILFTNVYLSILSSSMTVRHATMEGIELIGPKRRAVVWAQVCFYIYYLFSLIIYYRSIYNAAARYNGGHRVYDSQRRRSCRLEPM